MRIKYPICILLFLFLAVGTVSAQSSLYFFYDPGCMEKLDYERVNTFHDIAYTDFYIPVTSDKKAIFRVKKLNLSRTLVDEIPVMPFMCGDRATITDELINQINKSFKIAYMVVEEGNQYSLHEVHSVATLIENQEQLSYTDSKYGFEYTYASKAGDVLNLHAGSSKERSIYFEALAKNSCLNEYQFRAVSRHPADPVMKMDIISGLGVQRLYTDDGEMVLKTVNNVAVANYIANKCNQTVRVDQPTPDPVDPKANTTPKVLRDTVGMTAMEKALWASKRKMQGGTPLVEDNPKNDVRTNPLGTEPGGDSNKDSRPFIAAKDTLPGGFYLVQSKESLYVISAKFGITINRLMEINNLKSHALNLNQRLKVVDDGSVPIRNRNPLVQTNTAQKTKTTIHVVEQGQTLYGISKIYGITLTSLYRLNKQLEDEHIDINQRLVVGVEKI